MFRSFLIFERSTVRPYIGFCALSKTFIPHIPRIKCWKLVKRDTGALAWPSPWLVPGSLAVKRNLWCCLCPSFPPSFLLSHFQTSFSLGTSPWPLEAGAFFPSLQALHVGLPDWISTPARRRPATKLHHVLLSTVSLFLRVSRQDSIGLEKKNVVGKNRTTVCVILMVSVVPACQHGVKLYTPWI